MQHDLIELSRKLIQCASEDGSHRVFCEHLRSVLLPIGASVKVLQAGGKEHTYFCIGSSGPVFTYLGHSDVVPTGDESLWDHPPFSAYFNDTTLFGRGAVDMRASVATFTLSLVDSWSELKDKIRVVIAIPSDEETTSYGANAILDDLEKEKLFPDVCLVGEPSARARTGDRIRIGRRGGVSCTLKFKGKGGHTAYNKSEDNILHTALNAAQKIRSIKWKESSPPWSEVNFHFTYIQSGTGATNVVPESVTMKFNMRFSPVIKRDEVIEACENALSDIKHLCTFEWSKGYLPYFTEELTFKKLINESIKNVCGALAEESVDGGSSDGRFFGARGIPTIEVGTPALKLHETNESVEIEDLKTLRKVYSEILRNFSKYAKV